MIPPKSKDNLHCSHFTILEHKKNFNWVALHMYGCIDQTGSILLGTCSFNMNAVFHCAHVTVYSVDQKIKIMAQGSTYSLLSDERKRQHKSRYMLNVDIITLLSTRSSGTLDQYSATMRGGMTSWLSVQVFYCCPLHHASASAHWVLPLRIQLTTMNPCTGSPCTEWLLMNNWTWSSWN